MKINELKFKVKTSGKKNRLGRETIRNEIIQRSAEINDTVMRKTETTNE